MSDDDRDDEKRAYRGQAGTGEGKGEGLRGYIPDAKHDPQVIRVLSRLLVIGSYNQKMIQMISEGDYTKDDMENLMHDSDKYLQEAYEMIAKMVGGKASDNNVD